MTLSERIESAARKAGATTCALCGRAHNGAAWNVNVGWHGHIPIPSRRTLPARALDHIPMRTDRDAD